MEGWTHGKAPDYLEKKIIIYQLIKSPFWCSEAIDSINLKHSLKNLLEDIEGYDIFLDEMYLRNSRLKLSWENWQLNVGELYDKQFIEQDGEVPWE